MAKCKDTRITHGMTDTPTYRTWAAMLSRCRNPKAGDYAPYGGAGIIVCERWQSFERFVADMGIRPDGTSIDRIDNDGNYEPGNCRWATRSQQMRNRRITPFVEYEGRRLSINDWADLTGIAQATLRVRYHKGERPPLLFRRSQRLNQNDVRAICSMVAEGMSYNAVSARTGTSVAAISRAIKSSGRSELVRLSNCQRRAIAF